MYIVHCVRLRALKHFRALDSHATSQKESALGYTHQNTILLVPLVHGASGSLKVANFGEHMYTLYIQSEVYQSKGPYRYYKGIEDLYDVVSSL